MFGVVLAIVYVLPSALTPRAANCATNRRYPVARESDVPTDMRAVLRTKALRESSAGSSIGMGSSSSVV